MYHVRIDAHREQVAVPHQISDLAFLVLATRLAGQLAIVQHFRLLSEASSSAVKELPPGKENRVPQ
jgi:hypothetical protein